MGDFNFNAPQYVDFTSPTALELRDFGDEYFDMDHEVEVEYNEVLNDNGNPSPDTTITEKSPYMSFNESNTEMVLESNDQGRPRELRRSVSAGHISIASSKYEDNQNEANHLSQAMQNLDVSEKKKKMKSINGINILPSKLQMKVSTLENPKPLQKPRSVSRDGLHRIGFPTNDKLKRKMSAENIQQPNKYISLAEAINRFQFGTPQRFHSQSSKTHFNSFKQDALAHTIPQSPMLTTKTRSRTVSYLSRDEQEQMEADEMKKHQIKAQPVNYKILRAPVLNAKVDKKPNTLPQPFKFSEVKFQKTKVQSPEKEVYEFHARPAPKSTATNNRPIVRRSVMPSTVAHTPTFMRRLKPETVPAVCENSNNNRVNLKAAEVHYSGIPKSIGVQKPVRTKVEPFSFEERDRRMQQKKEEKIQRFLEEEKKAREFHARPIPSKVVSGNRHVESKIGKLISEGSSGSLKSRNDENMEPNGDQKVFKARPASVIHKKPFIPKKEERPLLEVSEFNLNTNQRAQARQEFEKKMKEKEEIIEYLKKENEETKKKIEEEEVNKLRKETVHKANPIKQYKAVTIQPSTKKVTTPRSPMITKPNRRIDNSMN